MSSIGRFDFDNRPAKLMELDRLIRLNSFNDRRIYSIINDIKSNVSKPIKSIIDLGGGTGHSCIQLKKAFPNANVTYLDSSYDLYMYAKRLASRNKIDIKFINNDMLAYEYQFKYDFVFSKYALKHVHSPTKAVRTMCEITENNGIICAIDKDVYANIWYPQFPLFGTEFMSALNKYNNKPSRGGDATIGRKLKTYMIRFGIDIHHDEVSYIDLCSNNKTTEEYKYIFLDVYRNLLPELVNEGLITEDIALQDIKKLEIHISNIANSAKIADFSVWGVKKC